MTVSALRILKNCRVSCLCGLKFAAKIGMFHRNRFRDLLLPVCGVRNLLCTAHPTITSTRKAMAGIWGTAGKGIYFSTPDWTIREAPVMAESRIRVQSKTKIRKKQPMIPPPIPMSQISWELPNPAVPSRYRVRYTPATAHKKPEKSASQNQKYGSCQNMGYVHVPVSFSFPPCAKF